MGSFLQYNDETALKVVNVLDELSNYIEEGILPNAEEPEPITGNN